VTTETKLKDWRFGQTQAERLVGALLQIENFVDVDPQHPLGGPDGTKDLLCKRNGELWVAAVYFPPTEPSFADIRKKFTDDFAGAGKNKAKGFAFFCNQRLTIGQREELEAAASGLPTQIYHLERIRGILDAPKGCGVRLEYLQIPMTEEEQWAFWSSMNQDVVRRLIDHEARRDAQYKSLELKMDLVLERTKALGVNLTGRPSSLQAPATENIEMPSSAITLAVVSWLHRILTEQDGLPEATRGRLRAVQVWIGGTGSSAEGASFIPVPPEQVVARVQELFRWWRGIHGELLHAPRNETITALAKLHHGFLQIHPFLDANGRIARVILDQASRELLGQSITAEFTADPAAYFAALRAADAGDPAPLERRISAALQ
jgi:fido (protein-threonine AMPylation protein)